MVCDGAHSSAITASCSARTQGEQMNINKDQILQFLRDQGEHGKVDQAAGELPDQVDTEEHGSLLSKLGVDPQALLGKLGDGLGNLFK